LNYKQLKLAYYTVNSTKKATATLLSPRINIPQDRAPY